MTLKNLKQRPFSKCQAYEICVSTYRDAVLAGTSNGLKLPHVLRSHEAHYRYLELIYADCGYPDQQIWNLRKAPTLFADEGSGG